MTRKMFFNAVLGAIFALAQSTSMASEDLVLRQFPIMPSLLDVIAEEEDVEFIELGRGQQLRTVADEVIMGFIQECGISFPEGAYARYNPLLSSLIHYNTEENQRQLGALFIPLGPHEPTLVQLDALFVDFPLDEIQTLARNSVRPVAESEDILQIWRDGKGELLHALKLVTRSGIPCLSEGVEEHIYLEDYSLQQSCTNDLQSISHSTPIPGRFVTREVGAIYIFTPTVGPDNATIDITISPELASLVSSREISVTTTDGRSRNMVASMLLPLFHSWNLTTSLAMKDQSTSVVGGMLNLDKSGCIYLILTATLIDSTGRPLSEYAGEVLDPAQQESRTHPLGAESTD